MSHSKSYISTRLDILISRLTPLTVIHELLSMDFEQIYQFLQNQHPQIPCDLSNGDLRSALSQTMYADFRTLLRPFNGVERRYLNHTIRWFELLNLKILIRGKFTGVSEKEMSGELIDLGEFAELPTRKLLETDDPFEMLRQLETTPYGGIVKHARMVFEEQGQDLFSLDAAIDKNFFSEVNHRSKYLGFDEQQYLQRIQGVMLDRFNLLWLLRFRFNYELSAAKSYYLLTSPGQKLDSHYLMRLAKMNDIHEVIDALPAPLADLLSDAESIEQIETLMEFYSLNAAQKGLSSNHSEISRLFSYLLMREAETRFIQTILKGMLLGFKDDLISQALGF